MTDGSRFRAILDREDEELLAIPRVEEIHPVKYAMIPSIAEERARLERLGIRKGANNHG